MDLRLHISAALMRRFARKAGSREQERVIVEKLITLYVEGKVDPFAEEAGLPKEREA